MDAMAGSEARSTYEAFVSAWSGSDRAGESGGESEGDNDGEGGRLEVVGEASRAAAAGDAVGLTSRRSCMDEAWTDVDAAEGAALPLGDENDAEEDTPLTAIAAGPAEGGTESCGVADSCS